MHILASSFILGAYSATAGLVPSLGWNPFPPICYSLQDTYVGEDFHDRWNWEAIDDPTHGRVNYVTLEEAKNLHLTEGKYVYACRLSTRSLVIMHVAYDDSFIMRADSYSTVQPGSNGRNSIRIQSMAAYGESLIILDLRHMPEGCATWPAFWTKSAAGPWPAGGEIDIIEGNASTFISDLLTR